MSDEERLEHLESTLEDASPEPWYTMGSPAEVRLITADGIHLYTSKYVEQATYDAFFCQAARADVPWLIAEYKRLRGEVAALTAERDAVETLLLDNGYGGAGFASLADAIDATLGELRRLERIVGVPQPERVTWERRVEAVLTRAEAAEAERDRLREALDNARVGLTGRYAPDAG